MTSLPHMLPTANYFCDRCDELIVKDPNQTDREFFEETVARHVNEHYEAYDPTENPYVLCRQDDEDDQDDQAADIIMTCSRCMDPLRLGYNTVIKEWVYEECIQVDENNSRLIVHRYCNSKTR